MAKKMQALKGAAAAVTQKKKDVTRTVKKVRRRIKVLKMIEKAARKLL